jgi:hypothetical protein
MTVLRRKLIAEEEIIALTLRPGVSVKLKEKLKLGTLKRLQNFLLNCADNTCDTDIART